MYIPDLRYHTDIPILKESVSNSDCDLEAYLNQLDKLREYFEIRFGDLDNVHVSE